GKPVREYEPFFSRTHRFEFGVKTGVSPVLFYDPLGRIVATLHPNHTYQKVTFDPWQQTTWDPNDTVMHDPRTDKDITGYVAGYFANLPTGPNVPSWQTWHAQREAGALGTAEQAAAAKAKLHADTPTTVHIDVLGRPFLTVTDNGPDPAQSGQHLLLSSRVELDIEGNQRTVRDADVQADDPFGRIVMRYAYDLLGHRIHQHSMEAGARWMLNDAVGKPLRTWDGRGHSFRTGYDPLRRILRSYVTGADPSNPGKEVLTERRVYGEQHPDAEARNLRGALHLHLDQAGAAVTETRDAKGNPLRTSRRLTEGTRYRSVVDWQTVDADHLALPAAATAAFTPAALETALAPTLEADNYTSLTTYDALDRPVTVTTPHTPLMRASVIRPGYNEANLLERVDVNLRGVTANGEAVWTPFIDNIDYDAKGRRLRIDHGNNASTTYAYDPLTFRLIHLLTTRTAAKFPADDPQPPLSAWPGRQIQNLHYTHDPIGNITRIQDDAQQQVFFANRRIEPSSEYTYDPLYRLTEATGREHLSQSGAAIPHSPDDALRSRLPHPGDGGAMGTYTERYEYDAAGNILTMRHITANPTHPGWTRSYHHTETSLLEDGTAGTASKTSNRLSDTVLSDGDQPAPAERYRYDAHGNMTRLPHLGGTDPDSNLHWDHHDQLQRTDLGGGTAYYVYDAAGQRVRKIWEKSPGLVEERIYLGGFEIYRRRQGNERLERETLHVMDGDRCIALVETRTLDTAGTDTATPQLTRYQYGNHLGSAALELDDQARIISYEEYTPYGSTSYQAVSSQTETPKRYRYTGKERDEETGLSYHGARYYASWLGRWTSCDPAGPVDGPNLYCFVRGNPIALSDPGGEMSQAAQAEYEKDRHQSGRMTPDEIGDVYKQVDDVPQDLGSKQRPSASTALQQQRRLSQGRAQRAQTKAPAIVGKAEKFEAAKAGARNWALDRVVEGIGHGTSLPGAKYIARWALTPLRANTPVAFPTTLQEHELKENYQAMQTTLTVTESAVIVVAPVVAESALATQVPAAAEAAVVESSTAEAAIVEQGTPASPSVRPDVPTEAIIPIDQVGTRSGKAFAPKVNNAPGAYRGVTPKMREKAQEVGERWQGPGDYDVGHRTPLSQVPPGERVRLRAEIMRSNRSEGDAIAQSNEMRRKVGLYTRK
ncbi:RHS repeat-associated core domain-containing protein, partial [Kitasatospora sp. NPDC093558]|uniref:RHS repeat domain-containing protein n=1 Tax=Kitasatospora sp. NPDC093558 TaxID=3155201 RepID=UPI0034280C87